MVFRDQKTQRGLVTDPPPDRLGDSAFKSLNMAPGGPDTARPRYGCSRQEHYRPEGLGRVVLADALTDAEGEAIGIFVVRTEDSEGVDGFSPEHTGLFIGEFRPAIIAEEYEQAAGIDSIDTAYTMVF